MVMATFVDGQHRTDYGHIVLTTDNVLHASERVVDTPSRSDGISHEDERDIRILGCELIQSSGLLLQLPQVAMATAQILFHRFYLVKSMVIHNYEHLAMAAIFLAAKVEEHPRRIRDVINCFHHIKQVKDKKPIQPMDFTGNLYIKQKNDVIKAERRLLKELGFCVHVKYPHKIIIVVLSTMLEQSQNTELVQLSWNFMNDSLRSDVFMRYSPDQIGCACIWLSARIKKICLPEHPPWYELLDCSKEQCMDISQSILELYCIPRPNVAKLERSINAAKEAYELKKSFNDKTKKDLKDVKKTATPSSFSPAIESNKSKDHASPKRERTGNSDPAEQLKQRIARLATENGSSDGYKNGNRRKHHSPRRRYSPISPARRKQDRYSRKKHRSSSESDATSPVRKHKHRSKRRVSSSSNNSDSSSDDSEAAREEARKKRHEQRKKLADQKKLQEKIRQLEKDKERNKKEKVLKESGKEHKHKVR